MKEYGMMGLKTFLLSDKNYEKSAYVWNMLGSLLMAFQSVIMLMILTRTVGLIEAGIFTIANANAYLFLTIGRYGMKDFQVSDVKNQFTFSDYKASRVITVLAMIVVSMAYVSLVGIHNNYTINKMLVILAMCLLKVVDAFEDLYIGFYQKNNRLDVGAKILSLRMVFTIGVFGASLIVLRNLLQSLLISMIVTVLIFVLFIHLTFYEFGEKKDNRNWGNVKQLLIKCFPLFASTFLSLYIGNAPKYSIDFILNDELQACYGFLSMPVFVIGLLNNFIFNPMLYKVSVLWNKGEIREFSFKILRQSFIVLVLTLICIMGAYLIGVPVLSWLYNTDLSPYKGELLILLVGGGFLGLSGLFNVVITIIRYQSYLMLGYLVVSLFAFLCSNTVVSNYGMMGAAVMYSILMLFLCLFFAAILIYGIRRSTNRKVYN